MNGFEVTGSITRVQSKTYFFEVCIHWQLLLTTGTSRCTYFTVTLLLPYNYNTANEVIKPVICERLAKFKIFKYTCIAIKNNNKNCYIFIRSPESLR